MTKQISSKIIEKIKFGDDNFVDYEKIFDDCIKINNCKTQFCSNFLEFKKTVQFFLEFYKKRNTFYAHLIHDIKSPMLAMGLAIRNNEEIVIDDIYKTNCLILEIINDSLALFDNKNLKKEYSNLGNVLDEIIQSLKVFIDEKHINIQIIHHDKIPCVYTYKICLERIFLNLLFNAIKFSPKNDEILITFQKDKIMFQNNVDKNIKSKGFGFGLDIIYDLCLKADIKISKRRLLNKMCYTLRFPDMF
ncbi:MAG: HAMP domain-containing histidine kinase [Cyanobacteria bacterium SIG30]|nr:HAMP domain-containing histidine kinase [Cyanobacteria bacterium SIG30]